MANYKHVIPFFKQKEGGLSRARTDTASNNPSPCVYNGVTGWHTNKGVTWGSFTGNASKVGYGATCPNFLTMPENIWQGIFKKSYWDFWDSDSITSQPLADFMTWTVWGSGGGSFNGGSGSIPFLRRFVEAKGYRPQSKAEIRAILISLAKKNERKVWEELIQERRNFYARLNQPANLKGWNNALDKYVKWGDENYKFGKSNKIIILIPALVLAGAVSYLIYDYVKENSKPRNFRPQ